MINSESASQRRDVAAFFDLDKTVIAKSSTLALTPKFYSRGLIGPRAALRTSFAHLMFRWQGADHREMERLRDQMSALCCGWNVESVRSIVDETLLDLIQPIIYAEAAQRIREHLDRGHDVYLVSASVHEVVAPIGELLGATSVIATTMEVEDGRYTGEVGFYAYAENKAEAVREVAQKRGYDLAKCHAYSDSITDVPLLELVGHPYAINPDRELRQHAYRRGWPTTRFSKPVTLSSRVGKTLSTIPARPNSWAVGFALSALVMGMLWAARRRGVIPEPSLA